MKRLTNLMLAALICLFALYSCKSDVDLTGGPEVIPDGEATVKLDFQFEGLNGALSTRGVNGNLNFRINNMIVLFYKGSADQEKDYPLYWGEFRQDELEQFLEERTPAHCEEKTYHGHVSLDVPYGTYRIYCVANVPTRVFDEKEYRTVDDGNVSYTLTEKQLREIQIAWPANQDTPGSGNVPASYGIPDAMFGYFTYDDEAEHSIEAHRNVIHHNLALYPGKKESFDKNNPSLALDHKSVNRAPKVTLDKKHIEIQAWLKRVVSKLTIGFDGSGLKKGVEIYIKSVSIRDVAATCFLGHDNSVGDANDVEVEDESGQKTKIEVEKVSPENPDDPRLNIVYTTEEGANGMVLSKALPAFPRKDDSVNVYAVDEDGNETDDWNQDWYDYVHGSLENTNPLHNDQPITLYFMENLQGVVTEDKPDPVLGKNPKLATKKGVGHYDEIEHNEDGDKDIAEGVETDCGYYKDGKKDGTYIEVKAYYHSKNPYSGKVSEGDITYRFMLGKNVTNDFNAERNCHYKLILSFLGDANDIDWHIDYEEKPKEYYFRIPYDLEDGGEENGFTNANDKWYKNENWNQSWVWYAYDKDHNPIAEIVKEIIYYDDDYTDDNRYETRKNGGTRKFYQVVTVYPMKQETYGNYITDLAKGKIVQVLDCDDIEETADKFYTRVGGDDIAMYYRYERTEQWKSGSNVDRAQNCAHTIKNCTIKPNIANGNDVENRHENYHFIKYDHETKTMTLIEEPLNELLPTRPYRVADKSQNLYPVVKIGASYWLRKNLRTTAAFTASEILGISGVSNTIYNIQPYAVSLSTPAYCAGIGCIYFDTKIPMYKYLDNDVTGETYGYLYNMAAIAGSNDFDAWTMNDFQSYEEAWRGYNEECNELFDPNNKGTWTLDPDDLTPEDGELYDKYFWYYEVGDGGYVGGGLVQLEDRFLDRTDPATQAFNDGQLAPKGWHIPTGAYDRQDARYVKGNSQQPEEYYRWSFGHVWQDHQYLLFYLGTDFFRGAINTNERQWPSTNHNKELTKKNLSGLSLLPIPADDTSSNLTLSPIAPSGWTINPKFNEAIIPYITNSFLAYEVEGLQDSDGEAIIGSLVTMPPVFDSKYVAYYDYTLESDEVFQQDGMDNFYIEMSKHYHPVRLVRHSFPESYAAQSWDDINGDSWQWTE